MKVSCKQIFISIAFVMSATILIILGVEHKRKVVNEPIVISYPRVVHNTCTNIYAIETSPNRYWGHMREYTKQYMKDSLDVNVVQLLHDLLEDTSIHVIIGDEFQFPDSPTAVYSFNIYNQRGDSIEYAQSAELRAEYRRQDSINNIFKCNHTYQ